MKNRSIQEIKNFVERYEKKNDIATSWGVPLVGFAAATDPLFEDSFDRFRCYDQLLKNVEEHKSVGYADVCGKCLTVVPCSHINPVEIKLKTKKYKSKGISL